MHILTDDVQPFSPNGPDRFAKNIQTLKGSTALTGGTVVKRTSGANTVEPATTGDGATSPGVYFGRDRSAGDATTPTAEIYNGRGTLFVFRFVTPVAPATASIRLGQIVQLHTDGKRVTSTAGTDVVVERHYMFNSSGNVTAIVGRLNQ